MPVINTKVLTTTDQGLTPKQKEQARDNIDAIKKIEGGTEGNIVVVGEDGNVSDSEVSIHVFRDVQADWADEAVDSPHHIKNKPEQLLADARVENDVLVIDKLYGGETVEFPGMSADERQKLAGIEEGAQVNVVETVKVAGSALTPDGNKAVDIPTATSSVKGVVKLATSVDSQEPDSAVTPGAVREALSHVGGYRVVELDEQTGEPDVPLADRSPNYIYLTEIPDTPDPDHYKEWIWEPGDPEGEWKCIGTTTPPLDDYIPKVANGTEGNLPGIASDGTLVDSGIAGGDVSAALSKLGGIENGAQANRIESITVNDTPTTIVNKNVNISIPKAVPDPVAANQMLFSADGATWAPVTWEIEDFGPKTISIGGREYGFVKIGNLECMTANLDYTWDGLSITATTSSSSARATYYKEDKNTYGPAGYKWNLLYNGTAVRYINDNIATIAPAGWRVPTMADFNDLFVSIGCTATPSYGIYTTYSGDIQSLRATGNRWDAWNIPCTDTTGFHAVPSTRWKTVQPFGDYANAYYWGLEIANAGSDQWYCVINSNETAQTGVFSKEFGCAVRLVKGTLPAGE